MDNLESISQNQAMLLTEFNIAATNSLFDPSQYVALGQASVDDRVAAVEKIIELATNANKDAVALELKWVPLRESLSKDPTRSVVSDLVRETAPTIEKLLSDSQKAFDCFGLLDWSQESVQRLEPVRELASNTVQIYARIDTQIDDVARLGASMIVLPKKDLEGLGEKYPPPADWLDEE